MNEDLISRSALLEKLGERAKKYDFDECTELTIYEDMHEVKTAPAVDTVIPVRCKDCKHGDIDDPVFPCQYYCHMGHMWNDAYHFCADGERKGCAD